MSPIDAIQEQFPGQVIYLVLDNASFKSTEGPVVMLASL